MAAVHFNAHYNNCNNVSFVCFFFIYDKKRNLNWFKFESAFPDRNGELLVFSDGDPTRLLFFSSFSLLFPAESRGGDGG